MSFPSRKGWLIPQSGTAFAAPRVLGGIHFFINQAQLGIPVCMSVAQLFSVILNLFQNLVFKIEMPKQVRHDHNKIPIYKSSATDTCTGMTKND
jgi:hypothetical protein